MIIDDKIHTYVVNDGGRRIDIRIDALTLVKCLSALAYIKRDFHVEKESLEKILLAEIQSNIDKDGINADNFVLGYTTDQDNESRFMQVIYSTEASLIGNRIEVIVNDVTTFIEEG